LGGEIRGTKEETSGKELTIAVFSILFVSLNNIIKTIFNTKEIAKITIKNINWYFFKFIFL